MAAESIPRSWRRRFRFSMRSLIVFVLAFGVCLGWLVRTARIQREAVAAIQSTGGLFHYSWEDEDGFPKVPWWAPRWLVALIGVDYFGYVTAVTLDSSSTKTDVAIAKIRDFTALEELDLSGPAFSDAELAHVKGLTSVTLLILKGTHVSDAGLVHLKGLTTLPVLNLSNTHVSDAGLVHLKALTSLDSLQLDNTQITDAGLMHLKDLTQLENLSLVGTQVTDAGVEDLRNALPRLRLTR